MIKRYNDHAANERTFLAWVRTAIAVMAFGFLIERFDLFLKFATPQMRERQLAPHGEAFANAAGLIFILLGVATVVLAGLRFYRTAKNIDTDDEVPSPGELRPLARGADRAPGPVAVPLSHARRRAGAMKPALAEAGRRGSEGARVRNAEGPACMTSCSDEIRARNASCGRRAAAGDGV